MRCDLDDDKHAEIATKGRECARYGQDQRVIVSEEAIAHRQSARAEYHLVPGPSE